MDLIVLSGLSGAGKSTALAALEDLGFYCVDNLPAPLLPQLVALVDAGADERPLAVGVDARDTRFLREFAAVHARLCAAGHRVELLFLEAPVEELCQRYSETRRRHPLGDLPRAIEEELALLEPIRELATSVINTRVMRAGELRQLIRDRYGVRGVFNLVLSSFGFKFGLLSSADHVFDARFLKNPYYQLELRPLTGLDAPVAAYVLNQEDATSALEHIEQTVRFVASRAARGGRSYLTVAIGCTGGQHRSVALTEALARRLQSGEALMQPEPNIIVRHRDMARAAAAVREASHE